MRFTHRSRILESDKTYNQNIHPKVSVDTENATNASEPYVAEKIKANNDQNSPELIEEGIRVCLELLNDLHLHSVAQPADRK